MADEWPTPPAGKGYTLADAVTGEFMSAAVRNKLFATFARWNAQPAFLVDPQSIYGTHVRTQDGVGVTSSHYVDARGQDAGPAGILVVSSKVAGAAAAVKLVQNPGSSTVFQIDAYGNPAGNLASHIENHYAGSAGHYHRLRAEKGYIDGQMTSGSAVLTSATAAFTLADEGKVVSAISYSRTVFGPEESGITATVAEYLSPTSVRLSRNATRNENPMWFTITNRSPSSSQNLLQYVDIDGSKLLYKFARDWFVLNTRLLAANDDASPLFIDAASATQSAPLIRVRVQGVEAVFVGNLGHLNSKIGTILDNSGRITSPAGALTVRNYGTNGSGKTAAFIGNGAQDQLQLIGSDGTTLQSRFDKNGRWIIMHTTAPAAADLAAGQAALWLDSTTGSPKLKISQKDAAGTFTTTDV